MEEIEIHFEMLHATKLHLHLLIQSSAAKKRCSVIININNKNIYGQILANMNNFIVAAL